MMRMKSKVTGVLFDLHIDRALLKAAREQEGWSINQVAGLTGLSPQTIESVEDTLVMPQIVTVALLSHIYRLPLDAVVKIEDLPF